MRFARRLDRIQPSMTLAINSKAQEMRADGIGILSLAAGEPDFSTPEFVKEAAKKAIDENFTHYTAVAGIPSLRKAAADYFLKFYQAPVASDNIIIGAGGKQCLYTFMQTMLNPGDEVLIPSPYWVSYPDMVLLAEGVPVPVRTTTEAGFKINPALLEKHCSPKTRILILNSPCNPTGVIYGKDEMTAIMDWAFNHDIYVLSDEIYDQLVYGDAHMTSAIHWFASRPEKVGVVNGLSKSFAMTGWRVGFMAAHPEIIKKMNLVQAHSLSNVCSIAQKAALAALTGSDECVREMRSAFERRRNLAMKHIRSWQKAICPEPSGAFYLFVDVHAYYNSVLADSSAFCAWLLDEAHVATVPGAAFGDDRCIRLSFAVSDETLENALVRIGEALKKL